MIATRYDELIRRLREAAQPGRPVPAAASAYVEKVRTQASAITDADVAEVQGQLTEDEIFELTVAAAVGAGLERLDAGLRALG